jgi:serine/threonine protein kinase
MAFGKYELLTRLRVGGMAEVWKARETGQPERTVALKRILPSFTDEADYVAMFIDEARLGMRLSHPNIVRAYELGQLEDEHYIALELIEGQDLGAVMKLARERQEPLPPALACRIAIEICSALHYAHELCDQFGAPLGIVHRDVSPQNVLVSYDGDVKLLDFGIAKSSEQLMRTQAGLLKGKHGYLSPEQAQGQPVDRRSDLFSLGVCLYELLSAQRLFHGSSDFSTIVRVRKAEIPALEGVNRDVPVELATIVHRALARERGARFQTALELRDALIAFVEQRAISCDRDALAHYLRGRFSRDAPTAEVEAPASDESTGLLAAFEAVEAPSALSAMTDLPVPDDVAPSAHVERLDPADPALSDGWGGDEERFDALNDDDDDDGEPLREWERPAAITPIAPAPARSAQLEEREPITDRPLSRPGDLLTRVVSYESTHDGQLVREGLEPTRINRPTPRAGAVAGAGAPAANGAEPLPAPAATPVELNAIALEWADEELSTQIYDPPPGEEDLVGASPRRQEEPPRRTRPTPTPTPVPRGAASFSGTAPALRGGASGSGTAPALRGGASGGLAPTPLILPPGAPTPRVAMSSSPPLRSSASVLSETRPSVVPSRVSAGPLGDVRMSVPTPRGAPSPYGPPARSSVPPARISLPPPGALPSPASMLHPELRVSMPPMGSNRASAPMRSLPPLERGPSRAALGWAAAAAAMIVAVVVVLLSWFGRPAPAILHVTTDPVDAVVTVDGVALSGTSSPFVATDLPSDVDHEIEVSRAGYHSWRTRLRLHPGRVLALPKISLQRETGTSASTLEPPAAAPSVAPAAPAARAPQPSPTAEATAPVPRTAPAAGPAPARGKRAPAHARDHAAPATPRTAAPPVPLTQPSPSSSASSATGGTGATGDADEGTLRVNSRPWSRVYIDGRLVGNTPQMQLSLAPGWHTVTLVNPDFGLQKVVTIRIKPGELVTKIVDLSVK